MSELVALCETVHQSEPLRIDRDKCVVFGVKVLGPASANPPPANNEYPRETRERAVKLLEGARSNIDHAPKGSENQTRSYRDTFGVHRNLRETGEGLVSDFQYNPKHPLAEQFLWDAEHAPQNVGFSIFSQGRRTYRGGKWVVEEIVWNPNRDSIDLVSRGATTHTLYEGLHGSPPMKTKKLIALLREGWAAKPEKLALLREMDENAPAMAADVPVPDSGSLEPEEALKAGFKAAIHAVVDDDKMDLKAKVAKIKEILTYEEKLLGQKQEPPADDTAKTAEARKPTATAGADALVENLRLQLRARDLCADAGIKPDVILRKALDACASEQEVKQIVEAAQAQQQKPPPAKTPGSGPRSSAPAAPLAESQQGGGPAAPKFEDTDDGRRKKLAFLRGGCRG